MLTDDRAGSAALAAALDTPISGYETESLVSGFRDLVNARAVDVVQPDVIWTGGITACRRVAAIAHAAGLACVPHVYSSAASLVANLHFIASIPNSLLLEFDQNPNGLRTELLTRPVEADDQAVVHLGDAPGLGAGIRPRDAAPVRRRTAPDERGPMRERSGDMRSGSRRSMGTVVVTDCDHGTMAPEAAVFEGAGVAWRLEQCRTAQDVVEHAADAAVLVDQYAPVTAEVLDALPGVRLVVRYGVGVDTVDVPAATERGVWVANVPDYGTEEVAAHAVALALTLLRGIPALSSSVRSGGWEYRVARPLRRLSTLRFGVIGAGAIGTVAASGPPPSGWTSWASTSHRAAPVQASVRWAWTSSWPRATSSRCTSR